MHLWEIRGYNARNTKKCVKYSKHGAFYNTWYRKTIFNIFNYIFKSMILRKNPQSI